jgi:hypothetical protein
MIWLKSLNEKKEIAEILRDTYNRVLKECDYDKKSPIWAELYGDIFCEEASQYIFNRFPDFHYSDPDASYYDDVTAFIYAFEDYANEGEQNIVKVK